MSFTFVTSTTGAGLSPPAARKVRGHVTRVVFAKRRADKALAQEHDNSCDAAPHRDPRGKRGKAQLERQMRASTSKIITDVYTPSTAPPKYTAEELAIALSMASSSDSQKAADILEELWSIILNGSQSGPGPGSRLASWRDMFASEPAFLQATMAAALSFWCSKDLRSRAEAHRKRAVDMIIDRIQNDQSHTDGFLGAAVTMAISERLLGTEDGWQMHIRGISGAVEARRQHGIEDLPATFDDLMILDAANDVFAFPRVFHWDIIEKLTPDNTRNQLLRSIASMARDLAYLRRLRNRDPELITRPNKVPPDASEAWVRVSIKCRLFQTHENPFVRSTAAVMALILNLTCPPQPKERANELAAQLKTELAELPGRSCLYMDLTSCSLILGAMTAEEGSEAEQWFSARLRRSVQVLRDRGWDDPYSIVEKTMSRDQDMLVKVRAMRPTLDSP